MQPLLLTFIMKQALRCAISKWKNDYEIWKTGQKLGKLEK